MTDAELISDSLVNTAAFTVLFDRHYRAIHRFVHARIGRAGRRHRLRDIHRRVPAAGREARDDAAPFALGAAEILIVLALVSMHAHWDLLGYRLW